METISKLVYPISSMESLFGVCGHSVPNSCVRYVDSSEEVGRRLKAKFTTPQSYFQAKLTLVSILQRKVSLSSSKLQLVAFLLVTGPRLGRMVIELIKIQDRAPVPDRRTY